MTEIAEFKGTHMESLALTAAIAHNCECEFDKSDGHRTKTCPPHMLMHDQRALDGMLYYRHLVQRLLKEEWNL